VQRARRKRQGAGVRKTAFTSNDGGRSWQPTFDILFATKELQRVTALRQAAVITAFVSSASGFSPRASGPGG